LCYDSAAFVSSLSDQIFWKHDIPNFFQEQNLLQTFLPLADAGSVDIQDTFVNKSLHIVNNFPGL
jgi:hypothetical protein